MHSRSKRLGASLDRFLSYITNLKPEFSYSRVRFNIPIRFKFNGAYHNMSQVQPKLLIFVIYKHFEVNDSLLQHIKANSMTQSTQISLHGEQKSQNATFLTKILGFKISIIDSLNYPNTIASELTVNLIKAKKNC